MLKITIIAVGKIKEKYLRDALSEYTKRLSSYCKLKVIEVEDVKTPDKATDSINEQILYKEAQKIRRHIIADAHVITLEISGQSMDSKEFAAYLDKQGVSSVSHLLFIIGGSLGLHHSVSAQADLSLSFSALTFPHQLMRVILLEQVYRAMRINSGEPYHK
jgi:23S rRNA (pseudouridine1915-N3)-methyltransferase